MDQYSVLNITKYKRSQGIGPHIDRHHIPENANPNKVEFKDIKSRPESVKSKKGWRKRKYNNL